MAYEVMGLRKSFGELLVLDGLDIEAKDGAVTVILGPSGCGKTTLLNILAGLDRGYEGLVEGFRAGRASYVFQEDRLLPWMSAADNVAFTLRSRMDEEARARAAREALEAVGLGDAFDQRPGRLSGGMRRRVALARAFAYPSDAMLLDEPFSALDLKTRISVMDLFLRLRDEDGRAAIVVTHDVREAIYLGDRIVTLSERPARVRDVIDLSLDRADRAFASNKSAKIEARLYDSILAER